MPYGKESKIKLIIELSNNIKNNKINLTNEL